MGDQASRLSRPHVALTEYTHTHTQALETGHMYGSVCLLHCSIALFASVCTLSSVSDVVLNCLSQLTHNHVDSSHSGGNGPPSTLSMASDWIRVAGSLG